MLVFVNNVYFTNESLDYIELIVHDQRTLSNKYVTLDFDACVKFCEDMKANGHFVEPLSRGEFYIDKKCRCTKLDSTNFIKPSVLEEDYISSVYELYWELSRFKCIYLDREDRYSDRPIGVVSEFSELRVSKSTMSITIPFYDYDDGNWKSKYLIKHHDSPEQQEFYCAVPEDVLVNFEKFGLKRVCERMINNKKFIVFKYNKNLSIYRSGANIKFSEPLIIHYSIEALDYSTLVTTTKNAIHTISANMDLPKDVKPQSKDPIRKSSMFADNFGVFFTSNHKPFRKEMSIKCFSLAEGIVKQFGDVSVLDLSYYEKVCIAFDLPVYCATSLKYLTNIFSSNVIESLDCVNALMDTLYNAQLLKLKSELYLYNLRMSTYLNPYILEYRGSDKIFNIFSSEGSAKVEVWV